MQKSIIEEIFMNNESLCEQIKLTEEYKKRFDEAYDFYEQLCALLSDEQNKILENFVEAKMGESAEGELIHFKEGFKVGLRLAMECLI